MEKLITITIMITLKSVIIKYIDYDSNRSRTYVGLTTPPSVGGMIIRNFIRILAT